MLTPEQLLSSEIIANVTMNRGRGLSGVNSYERELRFDIADWLETRVRERGRAVWLDSCCGAGFALQQAASEWAGTGWGRNVELIGVDLIDFPPTPIDGVRFIAADAAKFQPATPVDLVTCVHGLHYLGDKLGFLQNAYATLAPGGLLLGHLDTANLRLPLSWARLIRQMNAQGITLSLKSHLLRMERISQTLHFGLVYRGAAISERPNYTGITVIDSWYDAASG